MSKYEDKDILDLDVGGQTIRSMTSITFLHWLAKKIDGIQAYSGPAQELISQVSHPPFGNRMPDEEKVRLVRKLEVLNIPIP